MFPLNQFPVNPGFHAFNRKHGGLASVKRANQYLFMNKNQLVWCLRFGGCRSLGQKDANVFSFMGFGDRL